MFAEFEKIQEEAHNRGLPVIAWMYPRGKAVKNELGRDVLAYAARIGLELGADMIKMKYNRNKDDLRWIVKNAGKVKVLIAGGMKKKEKELLKDVKDIMDCGCSGLAIGRNIWQSKEPLELTRKIREIVFS